MPGTPPGMLGLTRWQGTRKPSVGAEAVLGAVWVSADATQRMRWIPATSTDGVWSLDLPGVGELLIVPTEDIHAATPPDRVVTTVSASGKKGFVILNPTGPRTVIAQPLDAPPGTSEIVVPPS